MSEHEGRGVMREQAVIPTLTMILPTGMDPDDFNAPAFAVYVRWQSTRGWTVTTGVPDERLSVKGRKWAWLVPPRNRRFYYFPSREWALQAAVEAVDDRRVNGKTWAEWAEWQRNR